jgi:hypothetical protein
MYYNHHTFLTTLFLIATLLLCDTSPCDTYDPVYISGRIR